ncbi:MAG: protease pro-enzyme activation domain-containing protein [Terracidiphilus sp.]
MATLRPLPLVALASALLFSAILPAQQALPASRIVNPIDENQLVTLKGNVNPHANAKNDRGPVSDSLPMADLTLLLSRTPEQQAAFDAYVQSEYDAGSANYHRWLTPAQIGQLYGPSQADIATISAWLSGKGFTVTHVALDRMSIGFSGTAGQVKDAFHTEIHQLSVDGKPHIANMSDPQIPAAISTVVSGIKGLHNFLPHPLHRTGNLVHFNPQAGKWQRVASPDNSLAKAVTPASLSRIRPLYGTGYPGGSTSLAYLEEDVSPYDFATIYNVLPLWNASTPVTGKGQTIAIAGTSDITLSDVTTYRSTFGLPAGQAVEEVKGANGIDPGICTDTTGTQICGLSDLEENTLDVEVSGGVATGAQLVLVTSGYNSQTAPTNDPLYQDSQYVIENHDNTSSSDTNVQEVAGASVLSLSYGECELYAGESSNVAYYNLWQSAAAEGIAVFVATGDSGSPSCDDGGDANGNPYEAQYGLSVNGIASTPYDTAVGGTDFSWCQPTLNSSGNAINGCPTTTSSPGPYWNSTNTTQGASAKGYVPETPWNDTCTNPIWAAYIQSLEPLLGLSTTSNPEAACNSVYNNWLNVYQSDSEVIASFVDTVGGSGGASNCVVNDTDTTSSSQPTCSSASTVTTANGSVTLSNDGWPAPSWQTGSGVTGTAGLTSRAIPDVSFFAGDGSLDSATLICLSFLGTCTPSNSTDIVSMEVGGTSVATPEMAGVMALINQKAGAPQGLPNSQLYHIAGQQNYSNCSAESVTSSSSCAFQSIDKGTNAMPCDYNGQALEGGIVFSQGSWVESGQYQGLASPNCAALNSGDVVGTLVSSGTTPGYNATAGFNMATGLGSMNVANVVNAWASDVGTATATVVATASPTTLPASTPLTVAVTVSGSSGTPTGYVTVSGGGASQTENLASGSVSVTIPANSLAVGSDTIVTTYSGDSTYAQASTTTTVTVTAITPTVTVNANTQNAANPLVVAIAVAGPLGSSTPTGTVTLTATGGYSSTAATLASDGTASITIPANSLPAGADTLSVAYSGNSNTYTMATGTESVNIVGTATIPATAAVKPASASVDSSQNLAVTITMSGSGGLPTGTVTLTSGSTYTSGAVPLAAGIAVVTINGCSSSNTNCLAAGSNTLTASYSGDTVYAFSASAGTATVTVAQSTYTLSAAAALPASVSQGGTATSTISGAASSTGYIGVVTLNGCSVTSSPTNAVNLPICSASGTITYAGGSTDTPTGTGTATVTTYANTAMNNGNPANPFKALYGAGGTVLAFLVFLGIPARRKNWRALLGAIMLLVGLGTLSACGGGGGGTTQSNATTPGSYTFTVTGTGSDQASTQESTTFTLTVN